MMEEEELFAQDEGSYSGAANTQNLVKAGGYRSMMIEILQSIREEVDSDALEELKIMCQDLVMDAATTSEVLSKTSLLEIFALLLTHCNNDLGQLVLIMNDMIPKIVHDFHDREKLQELSERIIGENQVFEFTKASTLYGRDKELQKLLTLMDFQKAADTRVVNVCGMAGIGKSFLVKHFGSRLLNEQGNVVIYVDVSGVQSLQDLPGKILESPQIGQPASEKANALQTLYDFLSNNKDENGFVLILDDLSSLMPNSDIERTNEMFSWINEFTKEMLSLRVKLKMVVTSQVRFKVLEEKLEAKQLLASKRKMSDYAQDIALDRIPQAVAKKFLGASLQSLSEEDKEDLVKLCDGHPYSLHFMSSMAEAGYTNSTEITKITSTDAGAINSTVADIMFPKVFEQLTKRQKLVLFAVALFDRDAQLGALYYILNPNQSSQKFYDQTKEEFSSGFLLNMAVCRVKSQKEGPTRKIVANVHHPLFKNYIKDLMEMNADSDNTIVQLKKRYITYHLDELVNIGKRSVSDAMKTDFFRRTNKKLMENQANFRKAFGFILQLKDPSFLFCKIEAGESKLRDCSDIVHLFMCFHHYRDWFNSEHENGSLMFMLKELLANTVSDENIRVLLSTLYVMTLALGQEWRELDNMTRNPLKQHDPHLISKTSLQLHLFCLAIHDYSTLLLYTRASFYKDRVDAVIIGSRMDALNRTVANLDSPEMSKEWLGVRHYFTIQILLIATEGVWIRNKSDISNIQQAIVLCERAKDHVQQAVILEPTVYGELASYIALEGHEQRDLKTASQLYGRAKEFHLKACKLYKDREMGTSRGAAINNHNYAVVLRSWATFFTEQELMSDEERVQALSYLEEAAKYFAMAAKVYEVVGSKSDLFNIFMDNAHSLERLQNETPITEMDKRLVYQARALEYYRKVYTLVKSHYRSCNLSPNDENLQILITRLPQLMRMHHCPEQRIDKVKDELDKIRHVAVKEEQAKLHLSGSDNSTTSSSNRESPDDDRFEDAEEPFQMESTLSHLPSLSIQPLAAAISQSAARLSDSLKCEEDEPTSSKRPKN